MKNKILLWGLLFVVVGVGFLFKKDFKPSSSSVREFIPITAITHGHGLSVDLLRSDKVYIATHHGLLLFDNGKLYRVGTGKDDYMGFSQHPTDPTIFFASGHPSTGGNIGFQKSINGGFDWEILSEGVDGPVDFHAMAVSPVNPDYVYGWFQGNIQRSIDGGAHFEIVNKNILAVSLTADSEDSKIVYAANPQGLGIVVTRDAGVTWSPLSPDLSPGGVSGIASDPKNSNNMLVFSEKFGGLVKSIDHGATWKKVQSVFDGTVLFTSFSRKDSLIVYALTHTNSLYKSIDGGNSWNQIIKGQKE